jgi:hypothetical protein
MGNVLAKLPQQRIRAPEKYPTIEKLEQLFDLMDELGLVLTCEWDVIYVSDKDRPQDKEWEIRDIVNSDYLTELPCHPGEYKLTKQVDVSPREAQSAPDIPGIVRTKASGLNHFKPSKSAQKKSKPKKIVTPAPHSVAIVYREKFANPFEAELAPFIRGRK